MWRQQSNYFLSVESRRAQLQAEPSRTKTTIIILAAKILWLDAESELFANTSSHKRFILDVATEAASVGVVGHLKNEDKVECKENGNKNQA